MDIYYDTEFIDAPPVVKFLSIGMVREDGKEYYAVNSSLYIIGEAARIPWLLTNVLSYLPLANPIDSYAPQWDESHSDYVHVKPVHQIAKEVRNFILEVPNPSLWAWFAAYDHLMLSQLYGKMLDIPSGIPQRTNDVVQEAERLGSPYVPHMPGHDSHHPLSDAREVKYRREWLQALEIERIERYGNHF